MRALLIVVLIIVLFIVLNREQDGFSEGGGIPRIIHQTAPSDKSKWHPIWEHCQKSWREKFPSWEYKFWSDEDLDDFMKNKCGWFYDTWRNYPKNIQRIDAARYFILYEYGGIYADMDFECLNNFEHEIPEDKVSFAESPVKNRWINMETHQNALMISPAKHPFWIFVFNALVDNLNRPHVLFSTGPQIIMHAMNKVPEMVHSLPSDKFSPEYDKNFKNVASAGLDYIQESNDSSIYSRHHGSTVWE
jgi:mannosyltransferase OCH1-like enzyme